LTTPLARWIPLTFAVLALTACGSRHPASSVAGASATASSKASAPEEKVLNVYNWSDYVAPDTVPNFEKEYGIKVNYDKFDSNDVLQTKLLAGRTGYDIVVPSANFLALQIQAGVFQKLDKSLLPNLRNVDPEMAKKFEPLDPGMQYAVNYFWGTSGVGYNVDKIKAALPDAPVDSFRMFYDPTVVSHFKDCGVTMLDEPDEILNTVFIYLNTVNSGKPGYKEISANSTRLEDLEAAKAVLMKIRPYIRYINSSKYIDDLATGEICLALGWNGDVGQAALRAREANNGITIKYLIPKEGAVMFFDMLAIPPTRRIRGTRTCSSTTCCARKCRRRIPARCISPRATPPPIRSSTRSSTTIAASSHRLRPRRT